MRQGTLLVLLLALTSVLGPRSWAQDSADVARKILIKAPAVYPTLARSMNIHGVVKLEVHVAPNGSVKSIEVKGGHPLLTQSAVTAVGHWKFEAAPHETKEEIDITFDPE
ncbi:MAG: energy transducer TonB [Candidatus Sulfotelmatobacter sp.]